MSLTGKTPEQVTAALNRASAAQNKAADKLPGGLAQTLQNQADRSAAMTAASSSTAKLVGDVATMFRDAALKAAADASAEANAKRKAGTFTVDDQKALDAALAQVKLWDEGGEARALLHGATQGVLAWIGGGYSLDTGLRGAGGAILASYLAPRAAQQAQKLLKEAGLGGDPQSTVTLAKFIGELAVTGIGASLGNMGAVTAANVYMNNYLKHKWRRPGDKDELQEMSDKLREAGDDKEKVNAIIKEYAELSLKNQNDLILSCRDVHSRACTEGNEDLDIFLGAFQNRENWFSPLERLKGILDRKANNFLIPKEITAGDHVLYQALKEYRNSNGDTKTYREFVLSYLQVRSTEAHINAAAFRYTLATLNITEEAIMLRFGASACRTVASAGCMGQIAQGVLIGDDMAKQIMWAFTGQAALSPLTQALVMSGLNAEDAKATMFLINMGVMEWTIVQGVGQLRATNAARAASAEQVAQLEQQTAKLNQALANTVNAERQVLSTTQLSRELKLADGTVIPKNSVVQELDNGLRVITPEGNTLTILKATEQPLALAKPTLPENYAYLADGTIQGPSGGSLRIAGRTQDGELIFERLNSNGNGTSNFFFDKGGSQTAATKSGTNNATWYDWGRGASNIGENWLNGTTYQNAVNEGLGLPRNTTPVTETLSDGTKVTTIPDNFGRPAGIVESKDVIYLYDTAQLEAQISHATKNGIPYNLVVSPNNQVISEPLWDRIMGAGGKVYQFNPATQTLTPITVRPH